MYVHSEVYIKNLQHFSTYRFYIRDNNIVNLNNLASVAKIFHVYISRHQFVKERRSYIEKYAVF